MSDSSALPNDPSTAPKSTPAASRFDDFGGYYAVMVDGAEVARFAPSSIWSDFATDMDDRPGWSYAWVSTDGPADSRGA